MATGRCTPLPRWSGGWLKRAGPKAATWWSTVRASRCSTPRARGCCTARWRSAPRAVARCACRGSAPSSPRCCNCWPRAACRSRRRWPRVPPWLERVGRQQAWAGVAGFWGYLAFVGESALALLSALRHPRAAALAADPAQRADRRGRGAADHRAAVVPDGHRDRLPGRRPAAALRRQHLRRRPGRRCRCCASSRRCSPRSSSPGARARRTRRRSAP